jgi:hypothetical protein
MAVSLVEVRSSYAAPKRVSTRSAKRSQLRRIENLPGKHRAHTGDISDGAAWSPDLPVAAINGAAGLYSTSGFKSTDIAMVFQLAKAPLVRVGGCSFVSMKGRCRHLPQLIVKASVQTLRTASRTAATIA